MPSSTPPTPSVSSRTPWPTALLAELGPGFAFGGRQVPLCVGESDFYLDLLFFLIWGHSPGVCHETDVRRGAAIAA